ncbi:hypothetical protein pb186bvf_001643 [Paramecium bursaria]
MLMVSKREADRESGVEDQYYPQNYFAYGPLLTSNRDQANKNNAIFDPQETIKTCKSKKSQLFTLTLVVLFAQKMNKQKIRLNAITIRHLNFISDKVSNNEYFIGTGISNSFASFYIPNECISFILKLNQTFKAAINIIGSFIENILTNIELIHPNSNSKFIWDITVFIVRIILLIIVPLDIGFQTGILFNSEFGITVVINVIIQLDFLVRSCTIHFLNGKLITNRLTILKYEMTQSLVGDLLTCAILIGFQIKQPDQYTNFILLCIMYQYKYVYQFQQRSEQTSYLTKKQKGLANLFKLLFRLLFALHVYSCLFYFVSSQQLDGSWIENRNLLEKSTNLQYLESFYFTIVTMLTIGYGDNLPYNSAEKIVTCLFIIFSSLWYSYSINFIGSIINDITQNKGERDKKIRIINKYFEKHDVPETLQYQIKEYLNYRWIEDEEVDINMEQQLINQLSEDLKEELNTQIFIKFTKEAKFFFNSFSEKILQSLQNKIKRRLLQPFELFTIEFDGINNLCFIEYGEVTQKGQFGKLQSQFLFNQKKGKFIQIQDFITDNRDVVTFQATSYVSLLTLSKFDFLQAIRDSPVDYQYYCEIRDSILFDQDHDKLLNEVYCNACQSNNHKLKECIFTHYIPDREVIIKRHCMPSYQQEQKSVNLKESKGNLKESKGNLKESRLIRSKFKKSTFIPLEQRKKLIHLEQSQKIDLELNNSYESISEMNTNIQQLEIAAIRIQQNNPIQIGLQQTLIGESCLDDDSQSDTDEELNPSLNEPQNIKNSQAHNQIHRSQKSQFANYQIKQNRRKPIMIDNVDFDMILKPPQLFKAQSELRSKTSKKVPINDSHQVIPIADSAEKIQSNKIITHEKYIVLLTIEHNNQKLRIQEFNEQFKQRLCVIYKNLSEKRENHSTKQYYQDVEFLYLKLNYQYFDDFDKFQNFEIYKINNNMPTYINDQKARRFMWQQKYINRFIKYMYNPYDYINIFLNENSQIKINRIEDQKHNIYVVYSKKEKTTSKEIDKKIQYENYYILKMIQNYLFPIINLNCVSFYELSDLINIKSFRVFKLIKAIILMNSLFSLDKLKKQFQVNQQLQIIFFRKKNQISIFMKVNEAEKEQFYPQNDFYYGPLLTQQSRVNHDQIKFTGGQYMDELIENHKHKKPKQSSLFTLVMVVLFAQRMNKKNMKLDKLTTMHLNFISDLSIDISNLFDYMGIQIGISAFNMTSQLMNITQQVIKVGNIIERFIERILTKQITLIHPNSNGKFIWDIVVFIVRMVLLVIVPLDIGFQTGILFNSEYGITVVINVIIQLDFLVRSCTIHFLNGKLITNRLTILKYEMTQSLVGDLLTCAILIGFQIKQPDQYTNFILLCIMYQYKYVYQFQQRSEQTSYLTKKQKGLANLFKLLFRLLFALHVYSCLFYFISSQQLDGSWIQNRNLLDKSTNLQYLESFYFTIVTMLTIGYGDNLPYNSAEKIVTCLFIIFSSLWYSYSINFIGSIINDITQNKGERDKKIRIINKYFEKHDVPVTLQYQIKNYLNYRWIEDDEVDINMEQQLINSLSEDLKDELNTQIYLKFIQESQFFWDNFSKNTVSALRKKIVRRVLKPHDQFTVEFDGYNNLCYIENGEITQRDLFNNSFNRSLLNIKKGLFLQIQDFITDNKDLVTYKALGYVSLLTLSKKDFLAALKDSTTDYQKYCQMRDRVFLDKDHLKLQNEVYCNACQSFDHSLQECGFTHYIPDKEAIIKRHCMYKIQKRTSYQDRNIFKKYTFLNLEEREPTHSSEYTKLQIIQQAADKIQLNNPNKIKLQSKLLGKINDDGEESFSESEDELNCTPIEPLNLIQKQSIHHEAFLGRSLNKQSQFARQDNNKRRKPIILDEYEKQLPQNIFKSIPTAQSQEIKQVNRGYQRSAHKMMAQLDQNETIKIPSNKDLDSEANLLDLLLQHNYYVFIKQRQLELNQIFTERLEFLYHSLWTEIDIHRNKQYFQDVEVLYIKLNHQELDDLDVFNNFTNYNVHSNMHTFIIDQKGKRFEWQTNIINTYIRYMNYPFLYISTFLNQKYIKLSQVKIDLFQKAVKHIGNLKYILQQEKKKRHQFNKSVRALNENLNKAK